MLKMSGLIFFLSSADLSDYLVRKGVPFREAHHVAGAVVKMAEERNCTMDKLTGDDLRQVHPLFGDDAVGTCYFRVLTDACLNTRAHPTIFVSANAPPHVTFGVHTSARIGTRMQSKHAWMRTWAV